jgi:hypothetical protein
MVKEILTYFMWCYNYVKQRKLHKCYVPYLQEQICAWHNCAISLASEMESLWLTKKFVPRMPCQYYSVITNKKF